MVKIRFEITVEDQRNNTESYWEKFSEWPYAVIEGMRIDGGSYNVGRMIVKTVWCDIETGDQTAYLTSYTIQAEDEEPIDLAKHGWSLVDGQ
jgi:hypothetical protein